MWLDEDAGLMNTRRFLTAFGAVALVLVGCAPADDAAVETQAPPPTPDRIETVAIADVEYPGLEYPVTETVDHVDTYHGTDVADPYRWLEEDVRESERAAAWVEAQNEVSFGYLEGLPQRTAINRRLTQLWDYERYGQPRKEGGRYFFSHNDGLQNQNVMYEQDDLGAEREKVLDPNEWSEDGTVALGGFSPSPDGRYAAYLVQDGGSDWRTGRIMDLETREPLPETLEWLKFTGMSWTPDGEGFYYSRYPEPAGGEEFQQLNTNQAVYRHRPGTAQSEDELVYSAPDHPEWGFSPRVTDSGDYLVTTIWVGTDSRYQIMYQDLRAGGEQVMLIEGFDHDYSFIGNEGSTFYFSTDNGASMSKIIAIDIENPAEENWRVVVPESDNVLRGADLVGGKLTTSYLEDAKTVVKIFNTDGSLVRDVDLPGVGSAFGFGGKSDDSETFFTFTSFNQPPTIYRYDVETGETTPFREAEVDFDPSDYQVDQVFYTSKDGTRVPMFITYKKGLVRDGANPTILYGYGGFDISMTPGFSVVWLQWMEMGGVYALANIRGGGEYGEEWHEAGTKLKKQNVFDDFIAAAEFLIEDGWTQPKRLAVFGGSNGGLLVGAVVNQRPDLFGAAIPAVGVMDMLRFHKFTAGRFWTDDYGSSDDPEEFEALLAYSPYHNVRSDVEYPAVLVTTADTDDRVVPGHSFKYTAALQAAETGPRPKIVRIETRAGHGAGKSTEQRIEEYADMWAFLAENLNMELPEGYGGN